MKVKSDFSAIHLEEEDCDYNWYVSFRRLSPYNCRHVHNAIELLYLFTGKREFFIKDRKVTIIPGKLLIINSNVLHKATNPIETPCEGVLIYVHYFPKRMQNLNGQTHESRFIPIRNPQNPGKTIEAALYRSLTSSFPDIFKDPYVLLNLETEMRNTIEETFSEIKEEITRRYEGWEFAVTTKVSSLFVAASRCLLTNKNSSDQNNVQDDRLAQIIEYINSHYMEELKLDSIASSFLLSPSYFSRFFKQSSGYTFIEYLNTVRVREAIRLLQEGDLKITHLAEAVGFGSVTHFGRIFKQITGNHPSLYRKTRKYSGSSV